MENTDNKKEQIIQAALKRFAHFGTGKTTMNEIAEDSSISKGNIYYYFPDKNALIAEVVKELLTQFERSIRKTLIGCSTTKEALEAVQNKKKDFFEKYYMLQLFEGIDCSTSNENIKEVGELASNFGTKLVAEIFKKGIENGELETFNVKEVTELYIQASRGLLLINKDLSTKKITIDQKLLAKIHHKQMDLINIFIKALSNH